MTDAPTAPRWTVYMPVADLLPALRNAKGHNEPSMAASVDAFGFLEPVIVDERTGRLLAGHGRVEFLEAAFERGDPPPDGVMVGEDGRWEWLVVRGISSRDDAHAEAMGIALNRVGERGGWLPDVLTAALDDLAVFPELLDAVGWTAEELDELVGSGAVPDNPWKDRPVRAMPDPGSLTGGQVWDIGPHRIVVGDATDPAVWGALPTADLLITDPPYGIGYSGGGLERVAIDDDDDPVAAAALPDTVLTVAGQHMTTGAGSYIFLPSGTALPVMLDVVHRHGLHRWSIVWAKDNATFARADFHPQHEHISYGWFPGPRRVPVEDRKLTTLWNCPRPRSSPDHPTAKPVALLAVAVGASSHEGDVVLDPFAGSGSTLIAAAEAGRVGVGIELRPEYARIAVDRLAEVTGHEPKMVAGD